MESYLFIMDFEGGWKVSEAKKQWEMDSSGWGELQDNGGGDKTVSDMPSTSEWSNYVIIYLYVC